MKRVHAFWLIITVFIIVFLILSPIQLMSHVHAHAINNKSVAGALPTADGIKLIKHAEILENMTGSLDYVGIAGAGHSFNMIGENDRYFYVDFGRGIGLIKKEDAVKVKLASGDQEQQLELSNESFITQKDVVVYDSNHNDEGVLGLIKENMRFPIVRETDGWYVINFMGGPGFVKKEQVLLDKGVVAIMYHHFLQKDENQKFAGASTTVQPSEFEWQMKYLKDEGYVTIDMDTLEKYLVNNINLPGKVVVITMDDGLKSNVVYAAPILRKYGFRANVFVITGRVQEENQPWNADAIVTVSGHEMEENKDVFDYHGHTHGMHYFDGSLGAMNFLPYDEALADLMENKQFLADHGFNTTHFAYPFGSNYLRSQSLLKRAHFTTAFTTRKGYNKVGDNLYLLKRWNIGPDLTTEQFESILNTGISTNPVGRLEQK